MNEWNKLDPVLRELENISLFKKSLLRFIRPKAMPVYGLMDPPGLKLLTRLRVNFSHLRENKFRHNFRDTLVPFCNCGLLESETTNNFLLRCTSFSYLRKILLDGIIDLIGSISNLHDTKLVNILLFGDDTFSMDTNLSILKLTISFLKESERFDMPLVL